MSALEVDVTEELRAAAEWRLLAVLFSRPGAGWREELSALAGEAGEPLRRAVAETGEASEGLYHALLGAGGPASPRAAGHAGFQDPGRILADLSARYGAFGYAPVAEEPDDHLAVECGFVAYLWLKEAYARALGEAQHAEVTREARDRFLEDHLSLVGHGLVARLPPEAPAYLARAAEALRTRLPPPRVVPDIGLPAGCGPECDGVETGCPGLA